MIKVTMFTFLLIFNIFMLVVTNDVVFTLLLIFDVYNFIITKVVVITLLLIFQVSIFVVTNVAMFIVLLIFDLCLLIMILELFVCQPKVSPTTIVYMNGILQSCCPYCPLLTWYLLSAIFCTSATSTNPAVLLCRNCFI